MEIVCKSCNTSHYLSDDKIPLETKIGKCKQCSAPITILGKKEFETMELELSTPDSISEQEATKNCDFCGEKVLAIAKKCRHCGSSLNDSASVSQNELKQNSPPPLRPIEQSAGTENWFYEKNGQRQSVTKAEIITLIKSGKISHGASVWKQGFSNWMNIESTELQTYLDEIIMSSDKQKPVGIVLIAIYSTFSGLMLFSTRLMFALINPTQDVSPLSHILSMACILVAVLYLASVYGLWLFQSWGWRFTFWLYVADIPLNIIAIFPIFDPVMTIENTLSQLIGIGVAIAVIFYIRKDEIKSLYGISSF